MYGWRQLAAWAAVCGLVFVSGVANAADPAKPAADGADSGKKADQPADSTQPKQPASGLIEDSDEAWVWTGMVPYADNSLHGASGRAGGAGTYGTYTFHGTAVDVYGLTGPSITVDDKVQPLGRAEITIDGRSVSVTTVRAPTFEYQARLCHVGNLSPGNHVIAIHAVEDWVVIDYLKVVDTPAQDPGNGIRSIVPSGNYVIVPQSAPDKCVTAKGYGDLAQVAIYAPSGDTRAVWHVTPLGHERYQLAPVDAPNEALSVVGKYDPKNNGPIDVGLYRYMGDPAQQWVLTPMTDGSFQICSVAAVNYVVDVNRGLTADGTPLIVFPNKMALNEMFVIRKAP